MLVKPAVKGKPRFKGISPDFPIENTLEDNIAGIDSAKSFALGLIKNENSYNKYARITANSINHEAFELRH
jgi:hypothetical protein